MIREDGDEALGTSAHAFLSGRHIGLFHVCWRHELSTKRFLVSSLVDSVRRV